MRLHLIISRHGLPATRVLWTTTAAGLGEYGSHGAAPTSAIASSRTPNIAFANRGYTIAQLLEDVNEVVPLETEPSVFDPEFSGQWGLEDYVVEVSGSECLHFMEVEGLLRDGDEVVIRALQLADLRARRLCGRHQIASDGKHLIDGVPFGLPFKHRTTSNRPAITIPPRKKRRTVLSGWDQDAEYAYENRNAAEDEEGDGEWLPPSNTGFGKELSILPTEHDMSMGTVIRHPVDHSPDDDSEDMDGYEPEEDELESELKALKADFEEPASQLIGIQNQAQQINDSSIRRPTSAGNRPGSAGTLSRGSVVGASSLSSKRSRADDSSPRASKAVRFNKGDDFPAQQQDAERVEVEIEDSSSDTSLSDSDSDSDTDSDSDSSSDSQSSDASSSNEEGSSAGQQSDTPDSDSSDDSSSEDDSSSDDDSPPPKKARSSLMAPPGQGSIRTKKSNNRYKLRRRLSKLKEIGVLPSEADFAALRSWEEQNGGWHFPEESSIMSTSISKTSTSISKADKKAQEQREFEEKRQKLLDDLASGGINVEEGSEKENAPPRPSTISESAVSEETKTETPEAERSHRRTLDIASSRRLLFGSLGMRTPKTKEDEETTRRKLAAQASKVGRKTPVAKPPAQEEQEEEESDHDSNWQQKLIIRATECILPDITLTPPPFPFVNRWDKEADAIIRERLGWGKKRKRKQRIQVYDGYDEYDEYQGGDDANGDTSYYDAYQEVDDANGDTSYYEDMQLNYDEEAETEPPKNVQRVVVGNDLPMLPADPSSLPDLLECEAKPGSIIAFRQLDMSKETNWQPRMSEYRVAEVHKVENGTIHVKLAVRDWRLKQPPSDPENDEPRVYSGFEMPGFDDDEEEDDGYRELVFAELSDPKLLKVAPWVIIDDSGSNEKEKGKSNAQEGSIISVVEDSMPNAQLAPPSVDMDLDETTFVTLVTANESPARISDLPSIQTPGGSFLHPGAQGHGADDDNSDSPAVPSPSFSGFHSARSSPGTTLRFNTEVGESNNLEGHTLIGDGQSPLADGSNQDLSALSFLSANPSISNNRSQSQEQFDRQVVEEPQVASGANGSGNDSLLSQMQNGDGANSVRSSSAQRSVQESPNVRREGEGQAPDPWVDFLKQLKDGRLPRENTDQDKDEPEDDTNDDQEDQDSLLHSNQSLDLSPRPSPPLSSSRSSRKPPRSAQREPSSQKSQKSKSSPKIQTESPSTSTRSKHDPHEPKFQLNASQMSEVVDLTSDPVLPSQSPTRASAPNTPKQVSKSGADDTTPGPSGVQSRSSTGKTQYAVEVSISPQTSQKKKKKRLSRKF